MKRANVTHIYASGNDRTVVILGDVIEVTETQKAAGQ